MSFFDEEHNPYEGEEMIDADQLALLRDMSAVVKKNKDLGYKTVGDRVLVWDSSRLREVGSDEVNLDELDHKLLAKYASIVVETGCRYNADIDLGEGRHYPLNLDLIIWNKTIGKKYRTSSNFVKRTDKRE
jgi:hypothetical protein